ncbi:MAG TPA: GNAT family N-acetyltransferase, partial [Gemmataceae bacterium]
IPWDWMAGGLGRRRTGRDRWWPHLLAADDPPAGFAYGSFLPGYGGYACYVGVAPAARGRGIARNLFQELFACFRSDAGRLVEPLPFTIWESHPPEATDGPEARTIWQARLRPFARVGGLWIAGVDFRVPNYMDRDAPPVKLELFLTPFDTPAERFDAAALRAVVAGLHRRVYTIEPRDELYELAQGPAREPRLRPAGEAG